MNQVEKSIKRKMAVCKHFQGIQIFSREAQNTCNAGINLRQQFSGRSEILKRIACTKGNIWGHEKCREKCPSFLTETIVIKNGEIDGNQS